MAWIAFGLYPSEGLIAQSLRPWRVPCSVFVYPVAYSSNALCDEVNGKRRAVVALLWASLTGVGNVAATWFLILRRRVGDLDGE